MAYPIEYSPEVEGQLRALTARQRKIALDGIERHLTTEPTAEMRNRKPMRPNPLAPWELRLGDLRVYYDVTGESDPVVIVLAVGIKERDRIRIGREVMEL